MQPDNELPKLRRQKATGSLAEARELTRRRLEMAKKLVPSTEEERAPDDPSTDKSGTSPNNQ